MIKIKKNVEKIPVTTYKEVETVTITMPNLTARALSRVLGSVGGKGEGRDILVELSDALDNNGIHWKYGNPFYRKCDGGIDFNDY